MNSTIIRIFLLLFILYFNLSNSDAQEIKLHFNGGHANYQMSELKAFHKNIIKESELPLKLTDNFPAYFTFESGLTLDYGNYKVGLFYSRLSTGYRATISDYSGAYYIDNKINSNLIGVRGEIKLLGYKRFSVWGGSSLGLLHSNSSLKEKITITDTSSRNTLKLESKSTLLELFTSIQYQLKYYNIFTSVGYGFDLKGDLYLEDNPDAFLQNNDQKVSTNWSGLRIRLGIQVTLIDLAKIL
ncbi:hypothetical protein ACXR6G_19620 [Ancylomarina sp. YFZ004]